MQRLLLDCGHLQLHDDSETVGVLDNVYVGDGPPKPCYICPHDASSRIVVKVETVTPSETREHWVAWLVSYDNKHLTG